MSGTVNPMIAQGTLNRVRAHIVLSSYTNLNIASSYMGKSLCSISFDDAFSEQIGTATGIVNSPVPYVMATISTTVLKTQSLANAWISQIQQTSVLGDVTVYGDSSAFPAIPLANVSVLTFNPAAFDGSDPTVAMTLRGVFYVNNTMWSLV